jgi:hypothetical protein
MSKKMDLKYYKLEVNNESKPRIIREKMYPNNYMQKI